MISAIDEQKKFLSPYLGKLPAKKTTKSEIVAGIRQNYLFTDLARMTNVKKSVFKHASLFIRYDYLRQLTSFVPEKGSLVPVLSLKRTRPLIHFTHSGQSAILQALGFLKSLGSDTFQSKSVLYWETEQSFELFNFSSSESPKIFWIDSSSFDVFSPWSIPDTVEWVVVDTTCWPIGGREFKVLQEKLSEYQVLTVRSHVKLDMLGVEYAPLGSVTLSTDDLNLYSAQFYQAARLLATTASPESIPPYLFTTENFKLCLKRTKSLQKSHKHIDECVSLLTTDDVVFKLPPHGLYFYAAFRKELDLARVQQELMLISEECGLKLLGLESFGFDDFSFQIFRPRRDAEFKTCIRVAYGASGATRAQIKSLLKGIQGIG